MSGWLLILAVLVLGGVLSTLGDRLGSRIGKARLSLFQMRPRRTAVVITVLTGSLISALTLGLMVAVSERLRVGLFQLDELETRLRSTNCGVILAITKVFLHLTMEIPKLHKQVFTRLRGPIITHMVSAGPELAFSCLQHILLLVDRNASVFIPEYKRFFLRVNDPTSCE